MECDNMTDFRANDIGEVTRGTTFYLIVKRTIDILGALIGLVLLSPIFLIVAIAIKLDSKGPIIFGHTRKGLHGKDIKVYKFRTMYENSQEIFNNFTKEQKEEFYKNFKLENDPRVTKIGDFLRRTSIDELPQLINVLKGDMALVGPRPLLPKYLPLYSEKQFRRHEVRPGITGWAQVNGRNDISWKRKFELDVWYVDHCSFLLDLKIIFMTIKKVFVREGISSETSVTMEAFTGNN